jgi:hypothetical protein
MTTMFKQFSAPHLEHRRRSRKDGTHIGRVAGPYIVTGYVGGEPNAPYVWMACQKCEHRISVVRRHINNVNTTKRCGGCGRVSAECHDVNKNA